MLYFVVLLVFCDCYCSVAIPQDAVVGLQYVNVVFPVHIHFLLWISKMNSACP